MKCPHCQLSETRERPERTELGYRRFRCQKCRREFNERTGTLFNRLQYPSDVVCLVEDPDHDVILGLVEDIDYMTNEIGMSNELTPLFRKRREYEHEKELRAVMISCKVRSNGDKRWIQRPLDGGVLIPIDPERLIQCIYVAPSTTDQLLEEVQIVSSQYGLGTVRVERSQLYKPPQYWKP